MGAAVVASVIGALRPRTMALRSQGSEILVVGLANEPEFVHTRFGCSTTSGPRRPTVARVLFFIIGFWFLHILQKIISS
jgi:hypothetical protein